MSKIPEEERCKCHEEKSEAEEEKKGEEDGWSLCNIM